MIDESVFSENSIKKFMLEKYNLKINKINKMNRGSANIYSLNSDKYILKEYQSKYDENIIKKEVLIINHLLNKKIPVPKLIKNVNNELYTKYKDRIVVVEEFIEGETKENNTSCLDELIDCARILGKIVFSLEDLDFDLPAIDVKSWFSTKKIDESLSKYNELLKNIPSNEYHEQIENDLKDKIKMLKQLKNKVDIIELDNLTIKNTHGDFNVLQFIYKNNKIISILDFAAAAKMPIVWELIRSYSYMDYKAVNATFDLGNLKKYVNEFQKIIKLNEYDIKYMPYIYLIQMLHSDYGYKQYIKDNSKISLLNFGFFRTNLCRYLYFNLKLIVDYLN